MKQQNLPPSNTQRWTLLVNGVKRWMRHASRDASWNDDQYFRYFPGTLIEWKPKTEKHPIKTNDDATTIKISTLKSEDQKSPGKIKIRPLSKHQNTYYFNKSVLYQLLKDPTRDHSFSAYAEFSKKLTFLTPWNVSFSKNFACALNELPPMEINNDSQDGWQFS